MTPQEIETRKAESAAAYELGAKAVNVALDRAEADGLDMTDITKERVLALAFENDNPFMMVSYGDEGHLRPAWFAGFNDHLVDYYGCRRVHDHQKPDGYAGLCNGWDLGTGTRQADIGDAMRVAKHLTDLTRCQHWAEDRGPNVSPRFAVIRAFQIGEPVSYGFNGDSYPAGRIIAITSPCDASPDDKRPEAGFRIITARDHTGKVRKFWRRRLSGAWKYDQTWSLMHGWHHDRNPSF